MNPQQSTDMKGAEEAAKDAINSIAERDIRTGDAVEVVIMTKDGIKRYVEQIRRD